MVIIRPGERVPIDGVIESGRSELNEAPITGESLPVSRGPGDEVYAGTINGSGAYRFMLTAIDGQVNGGGGVDKLRMRIWSDGGGLVYDNEMNPDENADPTTALGGGSIVIHKD